MFPRSCELGEPLKLIGYAHNFEGIRGISRVEGAAWLAGRIRRAIGPARTTPLLGLLVLLCSSQTAWGLDGVIRVGSAEKKATSIRATFQPPALEEHRFWDKANSVLFLGVGAARMLDYASTRHFRDRGVDEWLLTNDVVDNKALFVGIEAAATAASIGVSYLFHRSGHHKVERWVSIVHIGVGTAGSVRNFTLGNEGTATGLR